MRRLLKGAIHFDGEIACARAPFGTSGANGPQGKNATRGALYFEQMYSTSALCENTAREALPLASLKGGERERAEERSVHRPPRCFAAPLPKFAPGTRCAAYKKRFALKAVRTATAPTKIFTKTGPLATWRPM